MDDETTAVIQRAIDQGGEMATALTRLLLEYADYKATAQALERTVEGVVAERDRLRAVVEAYQRTKVACELALDDPNSDTAADEFRTWKVAETALLELDVSGEATDG